MLSEWQAKTFWYVFISGIIGGVFAIYSIIDLVTGESEEQTIQRILESKLQQQTQMSKTSVDQSASDTLFVE